MNQPGACTMRNANGTTRMEDQSCVSTLMVSSFTIRVKLTKSVGRTHMAATNVATSRHCHRWHPTAAQTEKNPIWLMTAQNANEITWPSESVSCVRESDASPHFVKP